jgi:dipeptidyl aminopeptidase/acylaminoacyl peptidase
MKSLLLAAASLAAMSGVAWAQAAPPPASAFGRIPAVEEAEISPNGQSVAILGGAPDDRSVAFATIDKPDLPMLKLGKVEAVDIRWAGDNYVIARIAYWDKVGARLAYRFERNFAVTTDGKVASRLLSNDVASGFLLNQPVVGVATTPKVRAMMLGLKDAIGPEGGNDTRLKRKGEGEAVQLALWSVDPATGRGDLVESGDFDTALWDLDLTGVARVRLDIDDLKHTFTIVGRPKGKTQWSNVLVNAEEESSRFYYGYSDPDDAIYLAAATDQGAQMTRRRLADGVVEPVGHPVMGSNLSLVWDPRRDTAVGVISRGEKTSIEWLDSEIGGLHAALSKAFKGKDVALTDWSADRTRFIVQVDAQDLPPEWYLFDRARKELSPLGAAYPELKGVAFGQTRWITYKALDGQDIPAYLTLPPGAPQTGGKLPLIVLPHGGPVSRDEPGFDWLTQFLATRGYAVLRPQFRGSWGFGRAFELAGRGEWGGKMQTDLLDGVSALAAKGTIDPKRVCIAGWSFGGYSALAGASLHPEAYRCAASIAGISDLGLLISETMRAYGTEGGSIRSLRRMLSDANSAKLRDTSPLQQVGAIRAPILLIHADQDTVVLPEQSDKMAAALGGMGKRVEHVVRVGDDHYLLKSATRTQMLQTLETFLAKNLPPKP